MALYEAKIKHTEETLTALAHMQYDLFCSGNRIARSAIAAGLFVFGALNYTQWWGLLLIAYGSYLISSKYAASNRTAKQLAKHINESGGEYPSSKYIFEENRMRVITLPNNAELDPLPYSDVAGLGADLNNFYIFRTEYGGYMIPKSELGDKSDEFKKFIERKTGKLFVTKRSRFVKLREWLYRKNNEPPHL
jgi:hypothetical protein